MVNECDVELMGYSWVEAAPWWQSWRRRGGVKSLEVNPASQSSRSLTFRLLFANHQHRSFPELPFRQCTCMTAGVHGRLGPAGGVLALAKLVAAQQFHPNFNLLPPSNLITTTDDSPLEPLLAALFSSTAHPTCA